jgi:hypothetical protein
MTSFTYDDTGETSQTTGSSTTSFTNLPNGTPLSETNTIGTYWYIDDGEGDVAALINAQGGVANTYSYSPTGALLSQTGTASNPLTFHYWHTDPTTGDYISGTGISTNLNQTLGFGGGSGVSGSTLNPECTFTDEGTAFTPDVECVGAGGGDDPQPEKGCDGGEKCGLQGELSRDDALNLAKEYTIHGEMRVGETDWSADYVKEIIETGKRMYNTVRDTTVFAKEKMGGK